MNGPVHLPRMQPPVEPPEVVRSRAVRRVRFVGGVLMLLLFGTGARGVQLSLDPSDRTIRAAKVQRWNSVTVPARRGEILDRKGRRLATSVSTPNIIVDPLRVEPDEVDRLARKVASILDLDAGEVAEKMQRDGRYAKLAARVHPARAAEIEHLRHPALWAEKNARRYYPEESLAAQIIGFVDGAGTGREGLEASLDNWLRGESLVTQRRRDRHGMSVDDPGRGRIDVHEGMDVHTTLDRTIQRITEKALEGVVERSAPLAATAVVVDVRTGDLLSMANVPTFNPNNLTSDAASRRNHVVQDAIEPGSVLKPFTAAIAVEEGLVSGSTPIDCENGAWYIGRTRIRDDHPHSVVSVSEVIKYSSNIGSAKLALQVGAETFLGYLRDFGFGVRSGIALPGERSGVLRRADRIRPIELATTSYGQGMTSTSLQLAMATAALANDGIRMKPRLITRIEDAHGVPEYRQKPAVAQRVVSGATATEVTEMMVTVTEPGGTATRAQVPGYRVAGKTGTAEKVKDGVYSSARIGSFIGYVPADDPVIAIVVSVDEPTKGSRYGGIVAAPAFAEIAGMSLRHLGIAPDPELLGEEWGVDEARPVQEIPTEVALSWEQDAWRLPDLQGRTMREVMVALHRSGLDLKIEGTGTAAIQTPEPGAVVAPGTQVTVRFE